MGAGLRVTGLLLGIERMAHIARETARALPKRTLERARSNVGHRVDIRTFAGACSGDKVEPISAVRTQGSASAVARSHPGYSRRTGAIAVLTCQVGPRSRSDVEGRVRATNWTTRTRFAVPVRGRYTGFFPLRV